MVIRDEGYRNLLLGKGLQWVPIVCCLLFLFQYSAGPDYNTEGMHANFKENLI